MMNQDSDQNPRMGWSSFVPYWGKDYQPRSIQDALDNERLLREAAKELAQTRALVRELCEYLNEALKKRKDETMDLTGFLQFLRPETLKCALRDIADCQRYDPHWVEARDVLMEFVSEHLSANEVLAFSLYIPPVKDRCKGHEKGD